MNKILFFLIILFLPLAAIAQSPYIVKDSSTELVDRFAVLADRGYSFEKILSDSTLTFIEGDSMRPWLAAAYWVRIKLVSPTSYGGSYFWSANVALINTFYFFNADQQNWVRQQAGILTPFNRILGRPGVTINLKGKTENVLYVKMDVSKLTKFHIAIKPKLLLENTLSRESRNNISWISLVSCLTVLGLFFLNNLYIYLSIKDKSVGNYLIAQLGGVLYVISSKGFCAVFFPCPVFTIGLSPDGITYYYDLSRIVMHVGILLILYGLANLTRSYLNTRVILPAMDIALRVGLYVYVAFTVILMFINVFWFYLENRTLLFHNVLAFLFLMIALVACVMGYLKKLPSSLPFLIANFLPILFMLCITLYHVFVTVDDTHNMFLTDLSIVSQALAFSVALVARTKSIQNDLNKKKLEAKQLEFSLREIGLRQQLIELENQKVNAEIIHEKTRNELLEERLEVNQRELASTTLYIVQKNELLATLKSQIQELNKQFPENKNQGLKGIESILESNLYLDGDWRKFKLHFEQVHPHFFDNLTAKYPSLTKNEIRLYAYFHINLSTKEIAALLNIDPASVRRAKTRLYKKMAITEEAHLTGNED